MLVRYTDISSSKVVARVEQPCLPSSGDRMIISGVFYRVVGQPTWNIYMSVPKPRVGVDVHLVKT